MATGRAKGPPDTPGWLVRVVPNKFPALQKEGESSAVRSGLFEQKPGFGAHEVIIETPEHDMRIDRLPIERLAEVLDVFGRRIGSLTEDPRIQYVQIFRNYGSAAGASLVHPHTQLIALPMAPPAVLGEIRAAADYFEREGRCLFCDLIEAERRDGDRLVAENDAYVAYAPFASRHSHEIWIAPKAHAHAYLAIGAEALAPLAQIMSRVLGALHRVIEGLAYNLIVHTAPTSVPGGPGLREVDPEALARIYHWRIEIIPRLTLMAGFEWATGMHINPTAPEQAAQSLRNALAGRGPSSAPSL